jgi:8-oxo-dGTP pyrophosphatase MutT (NUDIX family)
MRAAPGLPADPPPLQHALAPRARSPSPAARSIPAKPRTEAALREAWEELGIHRARRAVIGASDVYRTHSGYEITPVLAVVPPDIEINPSPTEVAQWFEAPVDFVFDPANHTQHSGSNGKADAGSYIEIMWQEHRIWG